MVEEQVRSLNSAKNIATSPEEAINIGRVIGGLGKSVSIGMDSYASSDMMANALISGLLSVGTDVWYVGIAPLPMTAFCSEKFDYMIMISSPDKVGDMSRIKIFHNDGAPLESDILRDIIRKAYEKDYKLQEYDRVGSFHLTENRLEEYIGSVSRNHHVKESPVILDCGCGCTSKCAPQILARIGCDLICINAQSDYMFSPRSPGVSKTDVSDIMGLVNSTGNIGIALNGDGTHLAVIDEEGRYLWVEEILALLLLYLKPSILVLPVNMSSMIDDAFNGIIGENMDTDSVPMNTRKIVRTDGTLESVTHALKEEGEGLGVTDDGSFIFSESSFCPDAIRASVIVSEIAGRNSIRNLIMSFPKYFVVNDLVHFSGNREMFSKKINEKLTNIASKSIYSIKEWRVEMDYGWFTISFNDDNPNYMAITSESRDKAYAISMMEMAKGIVIKCV